jgi:hypothetical protein
MFPQMPTTFIYEFHAVLNQAKAMRDPDQLFRDELLRPDPVYMTIRKGVTALRGMFTRSQETVPAMDSNPVQQVTSIVPLASDEDAPRIAA